MKYYCSLQICVLSYVLKSLTQEVCSHQAKDSHDSCHCKLFFFFCFHSRSLQHTLHYIFHGTLVLCVFGATCCRGCIIDMSKSRPWIKDDRVFQMYFQEKKHSYIRVNTVIKHCNKLVALCISLPTHYKIKKCGVSKIFEKSILCSARLHILDQKYNKVILWNILF